MKILVANDDGVNADGIKTLVREISKDHEVYVIAPDRERSAAGHALTLHSPIRVEEVYSDEYGRAKVWHTSGTPGDCVKIGINAILNFEPDLIISGINHGPNLGADVLYSGTVSAAMEGAVLGYKSLAVSLANVVNDNFHDFTYTAEFIRLFIPRLCEINFPEKSILNINIPGIPKEEIKGVQITTLGKRMYTDTYEKRIDPRGKIYYWLAGEIIDTRCAEGTDIRAIRQNKISITPVTFEMTQTEIMPELENILCEGDCSWYKLPK